MNRKTDNKPIVGISIGDMNGIGVEVILKALGNNRVLNICTPVIYGSMKVVSKYRKLLQLEDWFINQANQISQISHKKTNLINCSQKPNLEINPGTSTQEAGELAYQSLITATKDLKDGFLDALVTAPINKNNIQSENFKYPGHTEYFANTFKVQQLMLLVSEELRVGVVTGHIPLKKVAESITQEKITEKLNILNKSLKQDFGIGKPKIAVLGLNPHAGEEGLLGDEEQHIIRPVIIEMKKRGTLVFGPYPSDGFFGMQDYKKYDAVLAMYHDQGLIPFKTLAFDKGVNFTAGLPVVRTSPDHGTAYDIAGKNIADENSMLEAIFLAVDIVKSRDESVAPSREQEVKSQVTN